MFIFVLDNGRVQKVVFNAFCMLLATLSGLIKLKLNMTPKEKAKYLVEKFTKASKGNTYFNTKYHNGVAGALICVDEILNEGKIKFCGEGANDATNIFWRKVKDELSLL